MHRPLPPFVLSAITMVCAIWLFPQSPLEAEPLQPSNVVFILTDNQGAWTLGCYGNPDIRTPRIDRMAKEGVRFERAFSSNAVLLANPGDLSDRPAAFPAWCAQFSRRQ
ncbi:MAG: sulfatase-like hydrolase/transferase [Verrucomicrobiales bacterium]